MKKVFLLLGLISSLLMAELDWVDSYDAALEKAAKEGKMVMVMLSQEGCPACEYMKDIVFEEDEMSEEFKQSFVAVYVDIHNDFVPSGLGYIGTPTFHFLTAEGKKLGRLDGGANVVEFTAKFREVRKAARGR